MLKDQHFRKERNLYYTKYKVLTLYNKLLVINVMSCEFLRCGKIKVEPVPMDTSHALWLKPHNYSLCYQG